MGASKVGGPPESTTRDGVQPLATTTYSDEEVKDDPFTSPLEPTAEIEGISPAQRKVLSTLQTQLKRQGTQALVDGQGIPQKIVSDWQKAWEELPADKKRATPRASHASSTGEDMRFLRQLSERLEVAVFQAPDAPPKTKAGRGGTAGRWQPSPKLLTQSERMELLTIMIMLQEDGTITTIDDIIVSSVLHSLYPEKDNPRNVRDLTTNMKYWQQAP